MDVRAPDGTDLLRWYAQRDPEYLRRTNDFSPPNKRTELQPVPDHRTDGTGTEESITKNEKLGVAHFVKYDVVALDFSSAPTWRKIADPDPMFCELKKQNPTANPHNTGNVRGTVNYLEGRFHVDVDNSVDAAIKETKFLGKHGCVSLFGNTEMWARDRVGRYDSRDSPGKCLHSHAAAEVLATRISAAGSNANLRDLENEAFSTVHHFNGENQGNILITKGLGNTADVLDVKAVEYAGRMLLPMHYDMINLNKDAFLRFSSFLVGKPYSLADLIGSVPSPSTTNRYDSDYVSAEIGNALGTYAKTYVYTTDDIKFDAKLMASHCRTLPGASDMAGIQSYQFGWYVTVSVRQWTAKCRRR
jgi:hypothetical protein